jgi:hypothetical protein
MSEKNVRAYLYSVSYQYISFTVKKKQLKTDQTRVSMGQSTPSNRSGGIELLPHCGANSICSKH